MVKKGLKAVGIVLAVLLVTALLSVLQYAIHFIHNPMEREKTLTGTGLLIWGEGEEECEAVPVVASGREMHYLYRNEDDWIVIDDFKANGSTILREEEFDNMWIWLIDNTAAGGVLSRDEDGDETFWYASKDFSRIFYGTNDASMILKDRPDLKGKKAILVTPAKDREGAWKKIKNAMAEKGDNTLKEWLIGSIFEENLLN